MTTNEFSGQLYRTTSAMLDAIAHEFMTAGGLNSPAQINHMINAEGLTAERAAREAIEGWNLGHTEYDDEPSHMAANSYSEDDLVAAMQKFFDERPDIAGLADGMSEIDFADVVSDLRDECDGEADGWTAWTADALHDAPNAALHIVHHADAQRGGVVYVGSGSSGLTSWTDAATPAEVLIRYWRDDMRN